MGRSTAPRLASGIETRRQVVRGDAAPGGVGGSSLVSVVTRGLLRLSSACASATVSESSWFPELTSDGRLLFVTCALRNFGYGFISVILGLYLGALGLGRHDRSRHHRGTRGGAAITLTIAGFADRIGRRRILVTGGRVMAVRRRAVRG